MPDTGTKTFGGLVLLGVAAGVMFVMSSSPDAEPQSDGSGVFRPGPRVLESDAPRVLVMREEWHNQPLEKLDITFVYHGKRHGPFKANDEKYGWWMSTAKGKYGAGSMWIGRIDDYDGSQVTLTGSAKLPLVRTASGRTVTMPVESMQLGCSLTDSKVGEPPRGYSTPKVVRTKELVTITCAYPKPPN